MSQNNNGTMCPEQIKDKSEKHSVSELRNYIPPDDYSEQIQLVTASCDLWTKSEEIAVSTALPYLIKTQSKRRLLLQNITLYPYRYYLVAPSLPLVESAFLNIFVCQYKMAFQQKTIRTYNLPGQRALPIKVEKTNLGQIVISLRGPAPVFINYISLLISVNNIKKINKEVN